MGHHKVCEVGEIEGLKTSEEAVSSMAGSVLDWEKFDEGKYCAKLPESIFTMYWCNGRVHLVISGSVEFDAPDFDTGKLEAEQSARNLAEAWAKSLSPNVCDEAERK